MGQQLAKITGGDIRNESPTEERDYIDAEIIDEVSHVEQLPPTPQYNVPIINTSEMEMNSTIEVHYSVAKKSTGGSSDQSPLTLLIFIIVFIFGLVLLTK